MTALPTLDVELIQSMIRWAEASETAEANAKFAGWGVWDQGAWAKVRTDAEGGVCGTSFCMAGQAVTQAGYRLDWDQKMMMEFTDADDPDDYLSVTRCIPQAPTGVLDNKGNVMWEDCGEAVDIELTGKKVLGLTNYEAAFFFGGENELNQLKGMTNLFCSARGMPRPYPDDEVNQSYRGDVVLERRSHECYTHSDDTHFSWDNVAAV